MLLKKLGLFTLFSVAASQDEHVTVQTGLGKVRGVKRTARNGDKFEAFLGVPYARPPVDDLRWEPPQPADSWEPGVLDATKQPSKCYQDAISNPEVLEGSEDCLFLNVFVKPGTNKKHTLVWIHGGAFIFGEIAFYDPLYIMEQDDVILVSIQYRLNAFGFMSTEDKEMPGNYGSLDQVEALRWVNQNIHHFGGDPDEVTIIGMSAGGASVTYLTLSPLTIGLYKNSVALSGSPLNWWANIPHPKKQALKLVNHFNCPTKQIKEMLRCMRRVRGDKLMSAQKLLFFDWHHNLTEREPMNMFSPRPDPEREYPFLPSDPYIMLRNGDINPMPHMMGYTNKEGIWRANCYLPDGVGNSGQVWADFVENYDKVAPLAYGLMQDQTEDPADVTRLVTKYYGLDTDLREAKLTDEKVHKFIDVLSDSMFNYGIDETAKLRARHKKNMDTYFYMLTFPASGTISYLGNDGTYRVPPLKPLRLATHGTDMALMFRMFPHFPPMTEKDVKVSKKFIKLLLDFGRQDGSPIDGWEPLDLDKLSYLRMDEDFTVEKGLPLQKRMDFWKSLPDVYWRYEGRTSKQRVEL